MSAWIKGKLLQSFKAFQNPGEHTAPRPPKQIEPPAKDGADLPPVMESSQRLRGGSGDIQTIVIFNDVHIPFHHRSGCKNVLKFCEDFQPDNIVINGDFLDCFSVSIFPKNPGGPNLQDEIDEGREFLEDLRQKCPEAVIDYTEGNHEERLKRLVKSQHSLYGLKAFTIPHLLGLDKLDIAYHPYKHPVDFHEGLLSVVHGHRVSKHSAYSAKAHLLDDGYQNVIIGHTHRMGSFFYSGHSGDRRAFENGGLFDINQLDYVVGPNWQMGFCVVYLLRDNPDFLQIVPIEMNNEDGSFIWEGRLYGG